MNEAASCCETPIADTEAACVKCGAAVCDACTHFIEGIAVCPACHAEYESLQTMAEEPDLGPQWTVAVLSGLVVASLCAVVWALIALVTQTEYWFAAIGLGWLTGSAVHFGSGRRRGTGLGVLSSCLAVLSLFMANYFMFILYTREPGMAFGFLSYEKMVEFVLNSFDWYTGYDILWVCIAVAAAFRACSPKKEGKRKSARRRGKSVRGGTEDRIRERLRQFEETEPKG